MYIEVRTGLRNNYWFACCCIGHLMWKFCYVLHLKSTHMTKKRAGGVALTLYTNPRGFRFVSSLRHLSETFCSVSQSLPANSWIVIWLEHVHFLPDHLLCIIHQPSYYSTQNCLYTDSTPKYPSNKKKKRSCGMVVCHIGSTKKPKHLPKNAVVWFPIFSEPNFKYMSWHNNTSLPEYTSSVCGLCSLSMRSVSFHIRYWYIEKLIKMKLLN